MTITDEATATTNGSAGSGSNGKVIETFEPRSGESLGTVPDMGADEVAAAVTRARQAFGAWSGLSSPAYRSVA